ncbi:conserved protein of unknown function [Candidatus Nitrotoga arctica]|uniref:DUF1353 domain-containing protein n=1 Tax=Candidatus Nitrotoga arctica TaxID=453162 RepID=A0ABM8YZ42_9PROT|nr:conserved protein of unknown function [Candidatus Nitrotoga arctica]
MDTVRRKVLNSCVALFAAPFMGCAQLGPRRLESTERKAFIENAMLALQDEAGKESAAQESRGAAAALSLATLIPFGDWDYYYVKGGSILWRPNYGQSFKPVSVPEGFVTDLTSIPRVFWQVLRPEGRYAYAAVVHDYLYWSQVRSREESDLILKYALADSKVDGIERWAIYQAVDKLGQCAWEKNRRVKANGERRMLAKFPSDLSIGWEEWKNIPGNLR